MEQFVWTIVGAVLGLAGQAMYELAGQLRIRTDLFGEWRSTWQPAAVAGWEWVTETLEIQRSIFGIRLENRDNSGGYKWRGKARLINDRYLIGEWTSVKPGSNAEGIFALTFSTEGDYLLGYFLSRDLDRGKTSGGFVLGRTDHDMQQGRKRLAEMRNRFPREKDQAD